MVRTEAHRAALEAVVLGPVSSTALSNATEKPTSRPVPAARAERDRLLGGAGSEPSVDLDAMAEIIALAFPGTTEAKEAFA